MNPTVCSDKFPAGLRVLAVDDDPTCLLILEKMLRNCLYQVTKCSRADVALSILRENRDGFDVVISDVHMPDMDGFKLLEHVGLEMDLPVIMMSADDSSKVVLKGVTHGACDYLIKPVRMEALKNIWQHVVRKKKLEWREKEEEDNREQLSNSNLNTSDEADNSSSANEGSSGKSSSKKRKVKDDDEKEDTSASKKPRVIWTADLHKQFMFAVKLIGLDKAVPKKILEVMNVPWITRENVASHLQKYRLYMKKVKIEHCQNGCRIPLMGPTDPNTTPNALDFQNIAPSIQTARIPNNRAATSWAPIDQSNLFTYGNQRHQLDNNMQLNLLHGIPVNANLLPWNQALQPMIPNMGLGWNGVDTLPAQPFASSSHPPPFVGISGSRPSDNNGFPRISNSGMMGTCTTSNHAAFNTLSQNKNGGPTFDATRYTTSMQAQVDVVVPSALVQPGFSTEQRSVQRITTSPSVNNTNLGQQLPSSTAENSSPKNNPDGLADMGFGCGSPLSDIFGQDDLPSPFFKQPEEGLIQGESVFGVDELIPLG